MMRTVLCTVLLLTAPQAAWAGQKKVEPPAAPGGSDNYDELVARYLQAARASAATPGEPGAWMAALMGDLRARQVNDLVTIRVEETITAAGSADSTISKDGSASAGIGSFFGLEKALPDALDPARLASMQAGTDFKGAGATTRTGALSALLTARVAEVLPNGDLVLEGVREIDINGDRQIVVLTGIARWVDIRPGNVLSSTAIGQLRIRYFGKGLIRDNLSPGWLIRLLNKIF